MVLLFPACVYSHDPDDPSAFFPKAVSRGAAGDIEGARELLLKIPDGGEDAADAVSIRRCLAALDSGRIQPHACIFFFKGMRSMRAGLGDQAVREFAESSGISPDFAETYFLAGLVCEGKNDPAAAGECLRKAVAVEPGHAQAQFHLAQLLLARGDNEGAVEHYTRALESGFLSVSVCNGMGRALNGLGRPIDARSWFAKALREDPGSGESLLGMGMTYTATGDYPQAAQCFENAVRLFRSRGQWERAEEAGTLLAKTGGS